MRKYYMRMDIIRIISCLAVLFYHLGVLRGGYLAVCSFFVLTGYLSVVASLYKEKFSLWRYYKHVFLKIYLPLVFIVFISIGVISLLPNVYWTNIKPEVTSILLGYNNIWQLTVNLDYFAKTAMTPFTHLWYIALYFQFSIVFPFIFMLLKKLGDKVHRSIPCILLSITGIIIFIFFYKGILDGNIMTSYYGIHTRLFALLFGMLLAFSHYYYRPFLYRSNRFAFSSYIVALLLMYLFIDASSPWMSLAMLATCLLTMRLLDHSLVKDDHKGYLEDMLTSSASISYEIYLIQYPVIFVFQFVHIEMFYKLILILIVTLILSHIIHVVCNPKEKRIPKYILLLLTVGCSVFGVFKFMTSQDYTQEINEMKTKIEENLKIIEEKNKEYESVVIDEQVEIQKVVEETTDVKIDDDKIQNMVHNLKVTGIGDSVLLMGAPQLYKQFPKGYFDGKVSRSIASSKTLVNDLKSSGKLSDIVIIGLSTNGMFSTNRTKEFIEMFEGREIFWINNHNGDDKTFNQKFEELAKDYPNIHIIDWDKAANEHPDWIYKDGIHPREKTGAKLYAQIVYDAIYNEHADKLKQQLEKQQKEMIEKKKDELQNRITFLGDLVLANAFDDINEKFKDDVFKSTLIENYESLYDILKEGKENDTLDHKVILLFNKITGITQEQYNDIVDLLDGYEVIICNVTDIELSFDKDNVDVLNFYNDDYLMLDRILLNNVGNVELVNLLYDMVHSSEY